ncbi:hypothetical protein [Granulicella tundricola]|uniref:Uncharacterized protein n=1 Tax=Granulicella tundricola (strain ATCC BAA-1859 / DSM 23138 / MP5ACTX9) TaxID=1198114 RepID=E8X4P7_GRATM|nr:hypothetical protein [Granulicella tundricola]ADW69457.1 hypothetical protein AciX9_2420 [Granulicella tundricola MP5ACTX9]
MLRSSLAVILGFIVMFFLKIVLILVTVKLTGPHPPVPTVGYLIYNVAAACILTAIGGFVTGFVAEARRVRHGLILAMVILVMSALSYTHYKGLQAPWYQVMLVVVPPMFAVAGAKLAELLAVRHSATART